MPRRENSYKYSLFAFFAGWVSLAFVLFLQPLDLARFAISAVRTFYTEESFALNALSVFGFWISISALFLGMVGIVFRIFKNRSSQSRLSSMRGQSVNADDGEENWIFI